jgi:hypothetical protein
MGKKEIKKDRRGIEIKEIRERDRRKEEIREKR